MVFQVLKKKVNWGGNKCSSSDLKFNFIKKLNPEIMENLDILTGKRKQIMILAKQGTL